jgi:hypothetical protein
MKVAFQVELDENLWKTARGLAVIHGYPLRQEIEKIIKEKIENFVKEYSQKQLPLPAGIKI